MCGQSLQAQALFGGAGMKVFFGEAFIIWCRIPVSVATMNSWSGLFTVYLSSPVVLPM